MTAPANLLLRVLLLLTLIHCLFAYTAIPFYEFLGLDFQNLHAFHNCEFANTPYVASGAECGDVGNRAFYYPPVLYAVFYWTRGLSFESAYQIWAGILIASMLLSFGFLWKSIKLVKPTLVDRTQFLFGFLFWGLLLGGLPFVFSVERGNTDSLVVLIWSACLFLFLRKKYFFWGAASAFVSLFKLYPAISCFVVGLGFLLTSFLRKPPCFKPVFSAAFGALVATLFMLLPLYEMHMTYFSSVLPGFASGTSGVNVYSHTIRALDSISAGLSMYGSALLLLAWLAFSILRIGTQPVFTFTGALAISTFFSGTSYDYNLVTCYPLLLALFFYSKSRMEIVYLILGVFCFLGNRAIWHASSFQELRVLCEVLWLVALPLLCLLLPSFYGPRLNETQTRSQ